MLPLAYALCSRNPFRAASNGSAQIPVKFDWLEKTTRPSNTERVKAVLTLNGGGVATNSKVGGREADPWVPVNRELRSLFGKLHPGKSDARFFQRWNQGDGEGRLQFTEWFKTLLRKYNEHQILIFDPYYEECGVGVGAAFGGRKGAIPDIHIVTQGFEE